jgi:hypothetical protein
MVLETAALTVGKISTERAARLWLADSKAKAERDKDLIDLIKIRFRDQIAQRRVERQLEDITDTIAERLLALCSHEYRGLTAEDKSAALFEVVQTLATADLSDKALFNSDADPIKLAAQIRKKLPQRASDSLLGEAGARLYDVVLDECCDCIVRIVCQLPAFEPRVSAEILKRLSIVTEGITSALARMPIRSLDAPNGTADDEEFRRRYREQISLTLDSVELFGVRVERYRPRTTLSVAYISLSVSAGSQLNEQTSGQDNAEQRIADWHRERHSQQATVRVETALSKSRLTLVRGEAGSGKSTLLRWLAVTSSRSAFSADLEKWNGCIPFLIKLRSYADSPLPSPEHFLRGVADAISGLMPAGWVHRQLKSGRALLLVDGVDELSGAQRRAVRPWLAGLLADNPRIRMVVTSRPAAAGSDWLASEGFDTAFLERMGPADVRALILHWHAAMLEAGDLPCEPDRLVGYETALLARLEAAPHLQVLASSPLLATMLYALNLNRDTQLPRDRMSLYAAVLELLLERRDAERHVPSFHEITLERDQKIQFLQDLAWRLSTTSRTELPRDLVLRRISQKLLTMPKVTASPEAVLDHLLQRSGVLREPVIGRIDFVHRTIQEYLTAKQAAEDGDVQPVIDHAHRDQWHDIVVMTAGHANLPLRKELLIGLLNRAKTEQRYVRRMRLLVAACLETLPSIPETVRSDIEKCLMHLIPPRDLSAARSLATVGEPVLDRLPETLEGVHDGVARAIVRTLWLINGPGAVDVLSRYGGDSRPSVQEELVLGWEYFDPIEYASRVLSRTPFENNELEIRSPTLLRGLRYLSHIKRLVVTSSDSIADLSFLKETSDLSRLVVTRLRTADLTPLRKYAEGLTHLHIWTIGQVRDFTPLNELSDLTCFTLHSRAINDLEFVRNLPTLTTLSLGDLTSVSDYSPLMSQGKLTSLMLDRARQLVDVGQLPDLGGIRSLTLTESSLSCGLEYLTSHACKVTELNLNGCAWVGDIGPLANLNLRALTLWSCRSVEDLTPLIRCTELTYLDLENTGVGDLAPLAQLPELNVLYLTDCPDVDDLAPLAGLRNLSSLHIKGTRPGIDLGPLAGNRKLEIYADPEIVNGQSFGRRLHLS